MDGLGVAIRWEMGRGVDVELGLFGGSTGERRVE